MRMKSVFYRFPTKVFVLALLGVVAWLDYVTGYEISVFFMYVFPVALATWTLGLGWGLFTGLLAAAAARWADFADGHHYSHPWIFWERGLTSLIMLTLIAILFRFSRLRLDKERRKVKQLEGILHVCAVCQRIEDQDGNWKSMSDYLRTHTDTEPTQLQCPDCAKAKYLNDL
jgi:hypothetical protein